MTLASSKSFTYPVIFGGPVHQRNLAIMNIIIFVSDKKTYALFYKKTCEISVSYQCLHRLF